MKDSAPFAASVKEDWEFCRNCLFEIKAGYEVASGKRLLTMLVTCTCLPFINIFCFLIGVCLLCCDETLMLHFFLKLGRTRIKEAAQNVIMADA